MSGRPRRPTTPSGVPELDTLLGGGLPKGIALVVNGPPGSGKTILCSQIGFRAAERGEPVLLATVTSESQDKLLGDLRPFSFFKHEHIGEGLFFLSIYSALKKGPREAKDLLLSTVRERGTKLLIIDGFRSIRDLWQDESKVREFMYELGVSLAAAGCGAIYITEYSLERLMELPEATTVDGVLSLTREAGGRSRARRLEVVKLRGQRHLTGLHTLRIGDDGISLIPRAEAVVPDDREFVPPQTRAPFGLPQLDGLIHGGLPSLTTTLVAGSGGIGKTLLGLYFAAAGAVNGEPAVFYSFVEPPKSLIARASRVGLSLQPLIDNGSLTIKYPPPLEADADEILDDILQVVEKLSARRLVVDSLIHLEDEISAPDRRRPFFAALVTHLRYAGVTSLFSKQISKLIGPELDFGDTPIASVAENLIFLRHVEFNGRMSRVLSVLNLRDSEFDPALREFRIENTGVRVLPPMESVEGLLTGRARPLAAHSPASRDE